MRTTVTKKGKWIGVPQAVEPWQPIVVADSRRHLRQRRKLVLKYMHFDEHRALRRTIAKVKLCGLSYGKTKSGKRKRAAGVPIAKPCGQRICPHCDQVRRQDYADLIVDHLDGTPNSALGMLTLKMPSAPSTWPVYPHESGLLPALIREAEAYKRLQRTTAFLASRGGLFRLGVWRVHCRWSINEQAWDVHRHLIVAGMCLDSDLNAIRKKWGEFTGRRDPEAVHYERLHSRHASISYLSTSLASTFASTERHRNITAQLNEAWSMAFNHHAATAEYLWSMRQRPSNGIGRFGASANGNRRDSTSPPVHRPPSLRLTTMIAYAALSESLP